MNKIVACLWGLICWLSAGVCYAVEKFEILPDLPDPLATAAEASTISNTNELQNVLASQSVGHEPNILSVVLTLFFVILLIYVTGIIYTKLNKVGFKTFDVLEESISFPVNGTIVTYKNKRYECFSFNDVNEYLTFLNTLICLKKRGINVPKIIAKSKKELLIIRERFDQDNCLTLLSKGSIDEAIIEKLFLMVLTLILHMLM